MRNPVIIVCRIKDADQLCIYCRANQRLCFPFTDSMPYSIRNIKLLAFFYGSVGVGTPADRIARVAAQI